MTNTERFEEFKANVQQWATDRGIYANGKASSQLLKALSELGELADAIAKNDRDGIADGIGDVMVCIINYARINGFDVPEPSLMRYESSTVELVGHLAHLVGRRMHNKNPDSFFVEQNLLCTISAINGLYFLDCCDIAWNEIKDRRGFLNDQGVFVKESK